MSNELLEKLQYESAMVEDLVMAYAERKGLHSFREKWGNKPYSDEEHTLYNLVGELLEEIDKQQK